LHGIAGGGGEACFVDGDKFSSGKPTRGCLGGAFRYADRLCQLLVADSDRFALALLLRDILIAGAPSSAAVVPMTPEQVADSYASEYPSPATDQPPGTAS